MITRFESVGWFATDNGYAVRVVVWDQADNDCGSDRKVIFIEAPTKEQADLIMRLLLYTKGTE